MNDELMKKLEDSVSKQLDELDGQSAFADSEKYAQAVDNVKSLMEVANTINKTNLEDSAKKAEFKRDTILKSIETSIGVATFGLALASFFSREKWLKAGFELEQTGTFTVQTLKTLFSSILKK